MGGKVKVEKVSSPPVRVFEECDCALQDGAFEPSSWDEFKIPFRVVPALPFTSLLATLTRSIPPRGSWLTTSTLFATTPPSPISCTRTGISRRCSTSPVPRTFDASMAVSLMV